MVTENQHPSPKHVATATQAPLHTKKGWLDKLYYQIGKQQYNFRVNGLKKDNEGNVISTKWKKFSEAVFPIDFDGTCKDWKKQRFFEDINNREILPCEVVIDLEDRLKIIDVRKRLLEDGLKFYVFTTHSRGFHIHIFFKEDLDNEQKLAIIKRYDGDEQKANQGTTIALEFSNHWKSRKRKVICIWK